MYTALTANSIEISNALHRFTVELEDWSSNANIYIDTGILEFLSDAIYDVPDGARYIVWTTQSERTAHLAGALNLAWGFDGKSVSERLEFAQEITEFLQQLGLPFDWDGSLEKTINVKLKGWLAGGDRPYSMLGLLVMPGRYAEALEDRYGWNDNEDYGLDDLPEDIGHCYVEIRDGESLLDAARRVEQIPIGEVLAYQRCLSDDGSIISLEPYTHWNTRYI